VESAALTADKAVDGNTATRWSSLFSDLQWLQIDLGNIYTINQVMLKWETAYGKDYQIQVSNDGSTWTTIYTKTNGTGGTETLAVNGTGRYVRMYGTARGTSWGYSLWEMEVYGDNSPATTLTYNLTNFTQLAADWLKTMTSPADVTKDGTVDSRDLTIMMNNWKP
jgi:hypothetical protein